LVRTTAPHALFTLPAVDPANICPYEVTSDGQRFLVRVIVNWPALLKKGAAAP
jgi:hypothetical protein